MENEESVQLFAKLLAWSDATQMLIEAISITHPDPARLRDAWHAQLPQRVEEGMDTAPFAVDEYREQLLRKLADISGWLDGMVGRTDGDSNPPAT